jgi:signal transduction histidine kinase
MGGTIEVDDTPGGGTTFTFTIPAVDTDDVPPLQESL